VIKNMNSSPRKPALSASGRFRILRARAMFALGAKSLKRGRELGTTRTSAVIRFPDDSGLLFNYVWGKTLRDGAAHVFGVKRAADTLICPVAAIEDYISGARSMGIELTRPGCFLFPPWRGVGVTSPDPLDPAQLQKDLTFWLHRCGLYEKETWHGLRAGGAIELAIEGQKLSSVM
jgi:hypothetical protein